MVGQRKLISRRKPVHGGDCNTGKERASGAVTQNEESLCEGDWSKPVTDSAGGDPRAPVLAEMGVSDAARENGGLRRAKG